MSARPERSRPRPSSRPRYRYIAFRLSTQEAPTRAQTIRALQTVTEALASQAAQPWLTRFNGEYGILRVLRGHEDAGRRVLTDLRTIPTDDKPLTARAEPLSTSGTIAGLQRKALRGIRLDD